MNSFTTFVFLGFLAIAAAAPFTDEQMKKGREYVQKCIAETNVDPAVVQKLKEGDFSNSDDKAQCFTFCFFKAAGFVDENGNQNEDAIVQKLSTHTTEAQVRQFLEKCKNVGGATPCEKSFKTYQCYHGLFKN